MTHRSLRHRLTLLLSAAVVLFGLAAAAASFVLAYAEAKEFQDDTLSQIAVLGGPLQAGRGDVAGVAIQDPESRVQVFRIPGSSVPAGLSPDLPAGLHTLVIGENQSMRVFVHVAADGTRTLAMQPTEGRNEIALNSALRTLVPLLLLLPLLIVLLKVILRRSFAPIDRMAGELDQQSPQRPGSLVTAELPSEVVPFVQAINRLLARIGELLQQQRRFVADAAHELRSPLTALGLQLQNLRGADSLSEMQQRLQPLQQGVQRATQLTAQLLSLARSQAGAGEDEQVDVPALARQLLAEFQPLAEASRIDLGLQQEAAFCLTVPREGLRLILSNALENALRYTPAGGEVTLRLACESAAAVMEVIDSGPGISAAQFDRVFDPFFRVPGSPGNGSGLGLSIARESAIRLGGSLTLSPRQAVSGLVFRYSHPLPANAEG